MENDDRTEKRLVLCINFATLEKLRDEFSGTGKVTSKTIVEVFKRAAELAPEMYVHQDQLAYIFNHNITRDKIDSKMISVRKRLLKKYDIVLRNLREIGYRAMKSKVGAEDAVTEMIKRYSKALYLTNAVHSTLEKDKIDFAYMDEPYKEIKEALEENSLEIAKMFNWFVNDLSSKVSIQAVKIFRKEMEEASTPEYLIDEDLKPGNEDQSEFR